MRLLVVLAVALGLAGCDFMTDAATRLAYDLEREANALRKSGDSARVFTHTPKKSPAGITGPYTVRLVTRGTIQIGKYHTTYHLNFVEVPKTLRIQKADGEGFVVVLTRAGDTVQVAELR